MDGLYILKQLMSCLNPLCVGWLRDNVTVSGWKVSHGDLHFVRGPWICLLRSPLPQCSTGSRSKCKLLRLADKALCAYHAPLPTACPIQQLPSPNYIQLIIHTLLFRILMALPNIFPFAQSFLSNPITYVLVELPFTQSSCLFYFYVFPCSPQRIDQAFFCDLLLGSLLLHRIFMALYCEYLFAHLFLLTKLRSFKIHVS